MRNAIKTLKNDKALGVDQITAKLMKAAIELTSFELKKLFDVIWKQEALPTQWTKGYICKIPKKGNLQECGIWRGITLLPLAS